VEQHSYGEMGIVVSFCSKFHTLSTMPKKFQNR